MNPRQALDPGPATEGGEFNPQRLNLILKKG
jgi:hypothetical protein